MPGRGGADELAQDLREPVGILEMGEVRRPGERPEGAVRYRLVCEPPMLDGNRVVALTPHDHRRHRLEQVQAIRRAHPLAVHVDHGPERLQEGSPRSRVLERAQRPGDRLQVHAGADLSITEPAAGRRLSDREIRAGVYLQAIARALRPLENAGARAAFLQTLRAVIDVHGQRVSATDRLYLLESMPTMIVWGERDNTIPIEHGRLAHEAIPHSTFRTLPGAAHFPHLA